MLKARRSMMSCKERADPESGTPIHVAITRAISRPQYASLTFLCSQGGHLRKILHRQNEGGNLPDFLLIQLALPGRHYLSRIAFPVRDRAVDLLAAKICTASQRWRPSLEAVATMAIACTRMIEPFLSG
jgi:hypothetical protein